MKPTRARLYDFGRPSSCRAELDKNRTHVKFIYHLVQIKNLRLYLSKLLEIGHFEIWSAKNFRGKIKNFHWIFNENFKNSKFSKKSKNRKIEIFSLKIFGKSKIWKSKISIFDFRFFKKIDFFLRICNQTKNRLGKNVHLGFFFEKIISEFFFAKNFQVDTTSSDLNEFLIGQKILEAETFLLNLSTTFMGGLGELSWNSFVNSFITQILWIFFGWKFQKNQNFTFCYILTSDAGFLGTPYAASRPLSRPMTTLNPSRALPPQEEDRETKTKPNPLFGKNDWSRRGRF